LSRLAAPESFIPCSVRKRMPLQGKKRPEAATNGSI
jgi:hypothetical protein